jgi:predicted ATPase
VPANHRSACDFCSPHHQDSALYPIVAQTERAAGFAREDSPGEKLAKLRALLGARRRWKMWR